MNWPVSVYVEALLEALCVQKSYFSVFFRSIFGGHWLVLVAPFCNLLTPTFDPWHQPGIFLHTFVAHRMFSLFGNIVCEPYILSFVNLSRPAARWHKKPCSLLSVFFCSVYFAFLKLNMNFRKFIFITFIGTSHGGLSLDDLLVFFWLAVECSISYCCERLLIHG